MKRRDKSTHVTGVSNVTTELAPKRLEMLKALAPGLRRVWLIYEAKAGSAVLRAAQRIRAAAPVIGVELLDRLTGGEIGNRNVGGHG